MLTAGERAPTVACSPSSMAAWKAYRDLPVSRADSRGWHLRSHTHTDIFRTPAGACFVSRRFSEPLRIRSGIKPMLPGFGVEGERSCWSAERMCCATQRHPFPSSSPAAVGYHNLHLLLQPEAAECRTTAGAAQLQLAHIWHRREGLGLHHRHVGFGPSCRM